MREIELHRFWNPKWIQTNQFISTKNQAINVVNFGLLNPLQGPDFIGAEVEFNGQKLFGSIELHLASSDWYLHQHHTDERYNNVILHVVWDYKGEIQNSKGEEVPCIVLSHTFSEKDLHKSQYQFLRNTQFPCENLVLNESIRVAQFEQSGLLELQLQTEEVFELANQFKFDWERVLFIRLFAYVVDPQNRMAAYTLAREIPLNVLRRFKLEDCISWIVKQSGLWDQSPEKVKRKYDHLHDKPVRDRFPHLSNSLNWQHRNLRPGGYPMERIVAFLETLFSAQDELSNWLSEEITWASWKSIFGKSASRLYQNSLLPIWSARSLYLGKTVNRDWLSLLTKGNYERNRITENMHRISQGVSMSKKTQKHSYQEMAQFKHFCVKKQCSSCEIGKSLWNTI